MRVQVVIIGSGPAGLLLGQLLAVSFLQGMELNQRLRCIHRPVLRGGRIGEAVRGDHKPALYRQ